MTIVEAIQTAKVGQKVKRAGRGTASFVKGNVTVRLSDADYKATDWVVSVPKQKKTIKVANTTGTKAKIYKAYCIVA